MAEPTTPEEFGDPPSEQTRRLSEFIGSDEFQSLPLSEKFARLGKFMRPKSPFTREDLQALFDSERAKKLNEFQSSEEYQKLSGRTRSASLRRFLAEVYYKMPKSELEKRFEDYWQSKEAQQRHCAFDEANERLEAIRLLSSAQRFLRELSPTLPTELREIARKEGLNLPGIARLSPRLQDALKRAGWNEPEPMRDH